MDTKEAGRRGGSSKSAAKKAAASATQNESGAERGMSGERQFFLHREDTHADTTVFFRSGFPGKNESSFREVHFARQSLHLSGAEAAAVEENRQRVSGESAIRKDIHLHHGELPFQNSHAGDFTVRHIPWARVLPQPDAIP